MSWRSGVVAKKKRKEKKRKDIWFSHPTARGGGSLQNGRGLGFRLQKRLQPQWLATLPRQTVSIFPRPSGTRPSQPSHEGHELPAESIATFTKPKHGRPAACRSKQQHRRREAAVSRNWRFLAAKQATLFHISKAGSDTLPNRVYRRVILSDWGIPICKAGSREALLAVLAECIEGHESLRQKAGLLHRDISLCNGILIDLGLAVKEQLIGASGAKGKTGTRAFMAIGALFGE